MNESKSISPQKSKVDYEKFYQAKGWCDALDSSGVWRLGKIKKEEGNNILVDYDGWSSKWKQWHCKHSNTIAPLRTHTCGYTGQSSVTLREFDLQLQTIQATDRKLKILINDGTFPGFDAFKLTSFVRGDLFVMVDGVLTLPDRVEAQECHQIKSLFESCMEMSLKWMDKVITIYQMMRKEIGVANSNYMDEIKSRRLHVTSKATSLYLCGFENFLALKSIFGCDKRCTSFYEKNSLTINTKDLIQTFLSKQGLNKVTELLNYEDKEIPNGKIDFMILWPLLYSIPFLFNKVMWVNWAKQIQRFIDAFYLRLKKEFDNDLLLKTQLEKNPEFIEFLHALEKVHMCLGEKRFLLADLFNGGDRSNEGDAINLRKGKSKVEYNFAGDDDPSPKPGARKQFRDSILNPPPELQTKTSAISQNSLGGKEGSQSKSKEIDDLKQQLLNLKSQMSNIQKTMNDVTQGQKNLNASINEHIEENISKLNKVATKKSSSSSSGVTEQYLESFKKSGITIQEFEKNLGYIKQVYQVLNLDSKEEGKFINHLLAKTNGSLDLAKYSELSLGKSEDELKVLILLEYYLSNNRLVDALRLIKWRKKIIKLAQMNGWDVAAIIAERTFSKLDIDASDIIMSNLCLLQSMENVVGFGGDQNDDIEEGIEEREAEN